MGISVGEVRVLLAEIPGVHAAHGDAEHEPHMRDARVLHQQVVVRAYHVGVLMIGESRPFVTAAAAVLTGVGTANAVREYENVEGLA
ncbi:hypothetical protein PG985_010805 [Apiospora marii]|uniref:Uncharacterized protein n=1 Tax=Apiospora marii TaxID=335849 RepID=A0ABR1T4C6_9PEZI